MKHKYVTITNNVALKIIEGEKLNFKGENMLCTGAKLVYMGGATWLMKGYSANGMDIDDEATGLEQALKEEEDTW